MTQILLIEDNPVDALLMKRMLEKSAEWPLEITWIDDGQKALWYLRSLEAAGVSEPPALILLDMQLPKYDGLQVLEAFRNSTVAWDLPVIMLSSWPADHIASLAESRNLHADGYFQKPSGLDEFERLFIKIRQMAEPAFLTARTAVGQEQTLPAFG